MDRQPGIARLFVSYARDDGNRHAKQLTEELSEAGFAVWLDTRDISYHADFTAQIENAVSSASALILCLTAGAKRAKSFVRRELMYADWAHVPIIVARFDDVPPPIEVATLTFVDFHRQSYRASALTQS